MARISIRSPNTTAALEDNIKTAARNALSNNRRGASPGNTIHSNPMTVARAVRRRLPNTSVGDVGNRPRGGIAAKVAAEPPDASYDFDASTPAQSVSMRPQRAPSASASPIGAQDGLGSGRGGMAVHTSMSGANMMGYEPTHSSKRR